ncbi:MAG TPA: prephenate dehydratase domain-containing protein, partial [Pyrinomonadaceae bacterium]|nr:prephenate dehydratase domain-containing protein [Pyrinomonadaceae bacterium]
MAFQGERGAFSEEAAIKLLGDDIELVPQQTFAALFESLQNGAADYLVAPVENSIAGIVHPS